MTKQEVSVSVFNWGPCIIKLKIIDEFKNLLLEGGKKSTRDFRDKLAGILENEKGMMKKQLKKLYPTCLNILVYTIKCIKSLF